MHTEEACNTGGPSRDDCLAQCDTAYEACYNADPPLDDTSICEDMVFSCAQSCPTETTQEPGCIYANVYFLATCNGANVSDLSPDDVKVEIGDKDVGVEGSVLLTQQNGLQVDLLLDRSVPAESELPDTGIGLAAERRLSPAFIAGEHYGTRATTAVLAGQHSVHMLERSYGPGGVYLSSAEQHFDLLL